MTKSADQQSAPTGTRGEETRRRLLDATVLLVAELGWERVTTRRIAAAASVNQALIGYHFGSKDGLLRAALEAALREGFEAPLRTMLAAPSFADGAAELIEGLQEMGDMEPIVRFSMEALAQAPRDPELQRLMAGLLRDLRAGLAERISAAQARGEISPGIDPRGAATLLGAAFDGLGLHLHIDPGLDISAAASTVRGLLTRTLEDA